jgi:hypothetical protein
MNLYSAIVAAIAIWAVVRITQHWLAARRPPADEDNRAEIEALEARVRTLERIVTDRRESLERKFDEL